MLLNASGNTEKQLYGSSGTGILLDCTSIEQRSGKQGFLQSRHLMRAMTAVHSKIVGWKSLGAPKLPVTITS